MTYCNTTTKTKGYKKMNQKHIAFILLSICTVCSGAWNNLSELGKAINDKNVTLVKKIITKDPNRVNDSAFVDKNEPLVNFAVNFIGGSMHSKEEIENLMIILDFLIKNNAPLNQIGYYTDTPLHVAAKSNLIDVATLLIKNYVNINQQETLYLFVEGIGKNYPQVTPLHFAVLRNHPDMVKLLLENNADVTIKDGNGKTAYDLAKADPELKDIVTLFDTYFMRKTTQGTRSGKLENLGFIFSKK